MSCCHIKLVPDFANLSVLERFIYAKTSLSPNEQARALLIVSEYFDNIISHSLGTRSCSFFICTCRPRKKKIVIRYATKNFSEIITADRMTKPHFDTISNRYRGLGLRMCRNLASSIIFRKGLFKSYIIIIL